MNTTARDPRAAQLWSCSAALVGLATAAAFVAVALAAITDSAIIPFALVLAFVGAMIALALRGTT